jgi:hypothetical protein
MVEDRCQPLLDDDGNQVAVFHGGELDEEGRVALLDVVEAAKRLHTGRRTRVAGVPPVQGPDEPEPV